ncbi:MAG: hypothetical protein K2Y05_06535, partial [Hyphomicrobiaceae bacterium]|nr:hypothetical protein [Hyphomicrobiaceae bacterium]
MQIVESTLRQREPAFELDAKTVAPKAAVSLTIPRLADFTYTQKPGRISPPVLAGLYRVFEGVTILVLGFLIAASYVDEPSILLNAGYWVACGATALTAAVTLELLALYTIPSLSAPLVRMPRVIGG